MSTTSEPAPIAAPAQETPVAPSASVPDDDARPTPTSIDVVTATDPPPSTAPADIDDSELVAQEVSLGQRPRDPKVAQLRALFPNLEVEVLEAVLEGCGGSLDEATEQLLIMSDVNFKTDTTELSQLEADEELARQLIREDELALEQQRINSPHRSARSSAPTRSTPEPARSRPLAYQPYVPKSRRSTGAGPASPSLSSWQPQPEQSSSAQQIQPQRDELQELTEQFNKVADTGKRFFGNFLSKAKEQMNRLDDAIIGSASPPSTTTGSGAPAPPPKPVQTERTSTTTSWTAPSSLPRPAPPRNFSSDGPPPVVMIDRTGATEDKARREVTPTQPKLDESSSQRAGSAASTAPAAPLSNTSTPTATDSPKKDHLSAAFLPMIATKIPGLLPRQSFSLLDSTTTTKSGPAKAPSADDSPASTTHASSAGAGSAGVVRSPLAAPNHALGDDDDESEDDDLEYTRSPFDDD